MCSAVYVLLFRKYAKTMVYLSIYFSLGCSAAWAILCLAFGAVPFGIILLIVTVISAFFYWWIRNQLAMCAKLMSVAGRLCWGAPWGVPQRSRRVASEGLGRHSAFTRVSIPASARVTCMLRFARRYGP